MQKTKGGKAVMIKSSVLPDTGLLTKAIQEFKEEINSLFNPSLCPSKVVVGATLVLRRRP